MKIEGDGARAPATDAPALGSSFVAAVVVVTVIHVWLLLNDGHFWDAWLTWMAGQTRDWPTLHQWYVDSGIPQIGWEHQLALMPGSLLLYRVIVFACFVLAATALLQVCSRLQIPRLEALVALVIFVGHPAMEVGVSIICMPYVVSLAAFALSAEIILRGPPTALRHVALLPLLFLAFTTQSFLVLHVALLPFYMLNAVGPRPWPTTWPRALLRFGALIVAPFAYYFFMKEYFPTGGAYATYNDFRDETASMMKVVEAFRDNAVPAQITKAAQTLGWIVIVAVGVGAAAVVGMNPAPPRASAGRAAILVLASLAMCVAAVFPYVVVGKGPRADGWSLRHALLVPGALALSMCALAQVASWLGRPVRAVVVGAGTALALSFSTATTVDYLGWLGRAAKDQAIIAALAKRGPQELGVVWVSDEFPPFAGERYRYYELTGLFWSAWGTMHTAGFPVRRGAAGTKTYSIRVFDGYRMLKDWTPSRGHARLEISRGPGWSGSWAALGLADVRARLAGDGARQQLFDELVRIELEPIDMPAKWKTDMQPRLETLYRRAQRAARLEERARAKEKGSATTTTATTATTKKKKKTKKPPKIVR